MNNTKAFKIWEIVYPIGLYFVLTNVVMFLLGIVWPMTNENYIIQQMIATAASFPVIFSFYRREKTEKPETTANQCVMVLACAIGGIALNNLVRYTNWKETSVSYRELTEAFYGSTLILEILGTCIVIPILEEVLYRGIVYRRLREWLGVTRAVLLSAVIFGVMHFNMVQGVYAALIGVLLALCVEWGGLGTAIVAHMLTNLVSVLRSETKIFAFLGASATVDWITTIVASLFAVFTFLMIGKRRSQRMDT